MDNSVMQPGRRRQRLQGWLCPQGQEMGGRPVLGDSSPPRSPPSTSGAPLGGRTSRTEGRAIAFINRGTVTLSEMGLSRGNWGCLSGVTLGSSKAKRRFATFQNPRVCLFYPRFGLFYPRVWFWNFTPFSLFSSSFKEREKEKERGNALQIGIHGLACFVHGLEFLVTGFIHGLHRPSTGFPWMMWVRVFNEINGLGLTFGASTHPRVEMPPSPPRTVLKGAWHG